jgi:uncharacterized protein with GYD domain
VTDWGWEVHNFLPPLTERGSGMGTYIFLFRNDAEGAARTLAAGRSGADEQIRRLTSLKGAEVKQYAVTGRFDAVLIAELPSDAAALAVTLEATAAGQYVELLSALDPEILDAVRDHYLNTVRDSNLPSPLRESPQMAAKEPERAERFHSIRLEAPEGTQRAWWRFWRWAQS